MVKKSSVSHARCDKASRVNKARKIVAVLESFVRLNQCAVLDIGTGSGHIASELSKSCKKLVSVDIHDERKERRGYKYVKIEGERLPFGDRSFDVVVSNHVIEHIADQELHLSEIFRVLKKKGHAYIAFPNKYTLIEPHYKIPLLSWLPRPAANLVTKLAGKKGWDVYPMSYHRFVRLTRKGFNVNEFSEAVLREPEKYKLDSFRFLHPITKRAPQPIMELLMVLIPTRITVLQKKG